MKPPVEAPTSRQTRPGGVDAEGVERRRELDASSRDVGMLRARGRGLPRRRAPASRPSPLAVRPPRPGRRGSSPAPSRAWARDRARRGAGRASDAARACLSRSHDLRQLFRLPPRRNRKIITFTDPSGFRARAKASAALEIGKRCVTRSSTATRPDAMRSSASPHVVGPAGVGRHDGDLAEVEVVRGERSTHLRAAPS